MTAITRSIAHDETTFHEMIAEHLRHAPWLGISILAHALALLLLWALMPSERPRPPAASAAVVDTTTEPVAEPEPVAELETVPEQPTEDVQLAQDPSPLSDDPADAAVEDSTAEFAANVSPYSPIGLTGGGRPARRGSGTGTGTGGGPTDAESRIKSALVWLARHQDEDGKWDCDQFMKHDTEGEPCDGAGNPAHDVGVTGLALLAFLGDGHTLRAGKYKDVVKRGIKWLKDQQDPHSGLFGASASHDFIYDHAIATYAMCEAYGLSNYALLKPVAQKAIGYLEAHRNPYGVWRYQPRDNDNDLSITGWCIMAYESAHYFGIPVNRTTLQIAATWLDLCADASGRHGYTKAGERSSRKPGDHAARFPVDKGEAMTAAGLFCRFFLGQDPKEKPVMRAAADLVLGRKPIWDSKGGTIDSYFWYYGAYALFQMGGRHWEEWRKALHSAVVKTQEANPQRANLLGSWDPRDDCWGEDGGRVYTTAMLTLTLEGYYRYTRLLR